MADITVIQRDPQGAALAATRRRPTLTWAEPSGPRSFTLEARTVLGSAPGVDVVLGDPAVSRLHAELELRDDGVWLRDLGSRNGTWVEGVRVTGARVEDGARVTVGSTQLTLRFGEATVRVELSAEERFGPLLGRSVAMRELFARLARYAPTDSTVLLQGETGTGKELVAEALHQHSPRASGPFIIVDCGALPENLLEGELFGHAKGSFTGAANARAGALETADGGTVFLDEIGELPLAMQPKLLRAIESRSVRRIGEATYRKVNVRFISATHRDLRTMVNQGAFREDLFFRLAVLPVVLPPLRARHEDIPLLVQHFLPAGAATALGPELLQELSSRPWLGNVRELRNFVERAVALGAREALAMVPSGRPPANTTEGEALPSVSLDLPFKDLRERWLNHLEREYVKGLLERHAGNVSAVAQGAGLDRTYVHRLIRKHDL
ncbi:MAG: sigma 54-interacting transcriptional regulator [Deltaproteobacteria bacterium]|nr:sigma 54-interacting transcriptional regulator [Deltaproteobacteria bacterium]